MSSDNTEQTNLDDLRKSAIDENLSFGVTRLREQYRMKPKPDAEPSDWIKSSYNRKLNPIYRVSDCVPLRQVEQQAPTQKQLRGQRISSLKAKLRSSANMTSKYVRSLLFDDLSEKTDNRIVVYLDSETTGLLWSDQIIELGIVAHDGTVLFEQRFRPTVDIQPAAFDKHGISYETLSNCPTWPEKIKEIQDIMTGKTVIIFNDDFDIGMIRSTCDAFNLDYQWLESIPTYCAMKASAKVFGATNRYGTISLQNAADCAGVEWSGNSHSSIPDCLAMRDVMIAISSYCVPLVAELEKLEKER